MPAGFKFYTDSERKTEAISNLSDAIVMVYTDGGGNKYILDASNIDAVEKIDDLRVSNLKDIKIKYQPEGGSAPEEVEGLSNIIGKLFATKSASDSKTVLVEEVAKKPVVEAIFDTVDSTNNKKVAEVKLGGTFATKTELETPGVARKILGATSDPDGKKSILVEKLGTFLPMNDAVYGDSGSEKAAKDFLVSKGLGSASTDTSAVATKLVTEKATELGTAILGVKKDVDGTLKPALKTDLAADENFQTAVASNSALKTAVAADQGFRAAVASNLASPADIAALPALQDAVAAVPALQNAVAANTGLQTAVKTALASDTTFQGNVKITVNSNEPEFQGAVREVMSKPVFEIPADDNALLSWDW